MEYTQTVRRGPDLDSDYVPNSLRPETRWHSVVPRKEVARGRRRPGPRRELITTVAVVRPSTLCRRWSKVPSPLRLSHPSRGETSARPPVVGPPLLGRVLLSTAVCADNLVGLRAETPKTTLRSQGRRSSQTPAPTQTPWPFERALHTEPWKDRHWPPVDARLPRGRGGRGDGDGTGRWVRNVSGLYPRSESSRCRLEER